MNATHSNPLRLRIDAQPGVGRHARVRIASPERQLGAARRNGTPAFHP